MQLLIDVIGMVPNGVL